MVKGACALLETGFGVVGRKKNHKKHDVVASGNNATRSGRQKLAKQTMTTNRMDGTYASRMDSKRSVEGEQTERKRHHERTEMRCISYGTDATDVTPEVRTDTTQRKRDNTNKKRKRIANLQMVGDTMG